MHKVTAWRPRATKYFYWLTFIGTLLIVTEALRMVRTFHFFRTPFLDVLASYAFLGSVWLVVALAGSAVLGAAEALAGRAGWRLLSAIPRAVIFCLIVTVWLNLLRLLLEANGFALARVPVLVQLLAFCLLAFVAFGLQAARVCDWVDATARRLRLPSAVSAIVFPVLTLYLLLEPFNQGRPAPVWITDHSHKLPNVVVVVLDSLTSRDMSLYGYHLPTTPELDRLSRTWTVYENAHSAASGTLGSLPILLAGRYPYLDDWPRYGNLVQAGRGWMNLAQALRAAGYETVYMGGMGHFPSTYHLHKGFSRIVGETTVPYLALTSWSSLVTRAMVAEYTWGSAWPGWASGSATAFPEPVYGYAEEYFRRQAQARNGKPFFAYLHMARPHEYYLGNRFMGTFLPLKAGFTDAKSQQEAFGTVAPRAYTADQQPAIDRLRLRYDENIRMADTQVGHLIGTLRELGLYDQTLIVVTADHGENFAGGYVTHYTPLLAAAEHAIPLLIKFPDQTVGRREGALVSNLDIVPTVLDVIGAAYPPDWVDGQSLLLAGQSDRRVLYVRLPGEPADCRDFTFAALHGNLKLVSRKGDLYLFNLAEDPDEQVNLLGQLEAGRLRDALDQFARRMEYLREGGDIFEAPALVRSLEP